MESKAEDPRPAPPGGWSWIEDLQEGLDFGELPEFPEALAEESAFGALADAQDVEAFIWDVADRAADAHDADLAAWIAEADARWYETARSEGLLEGVDDFYRAVGIAQRECYKEEMREHLGDALQYAAYEHVKKAYGGAAISDGLAERIGKIDGSSFSGDVRDAVDEAVAELAQDGEPGVMTKDEAARAAAGPDSETEEPSLDAESRDAREASAELAGAPQGVKAKKR